MLQSLKNSFKLASGRVALAGADIKSALTKKSDAINQVVILVIILAVSLAAVLLYKGFADGVIQKVFGKVGEVIDSMFTSGGTPTT